MRFCLTSVDAAGRDPDGPDARGRLLGSGAHGAVRLGQHVQTGECECSHNSATLLWLPRCAVGTRAPRELADANAAACVPALSRRRCRQDLTDRRRALGLQGDDCAHPAGSPSHRPASWRAGASLRPVPAEAASSPWPSLWQRTCGADPPLSACPSPPQVDMHHERVYMIMELCQARNWRGWGAE